MIAVTTEAWVALGSILSGIGSLLVGIVAIRKAGKDDKA